VLQGTHPSASTRCQTGSVPPDGSFVTRLVGVSFCEGYPDTLVRLRDAIAAGETASVELLRDANNPVDQNAVNVMCVAAGGRIGRIAKERAKYLAPALDNGESWGGEVETVLLNLDHLDKPGVTVRCYVRSEARDNQP